MIDQIKLVTSTSFVNKIRQNVLQLAEFLLPCCFCQSIIFCSTLGGVSSLAVECCCRLRGQVLTKEAALKVMVLAQSTSELAAYVKPCTEGVRMTTWGHLSGKIIAIICHRQITSTSWRHGAFYEIPSIHLLLLEVVWAFCTLPSFILSSILGMNRFVPSDIAQTATTLVFVQLVCARPVAAIFGWLGKAFPWWAFWLAP